MHELEAGGDGEEGEKLEGRLRGGGAAEGHDQHRLRREGMGARQKECSTGGGMNRRARREDAAAGNSKENSILENQRAWKKVATQGPSCRLIY